MVVGGERSHTAKRGTGFRRWRQLLANRGAWTTARAAAAILRHRLVPGRTALLPSELWRSPGLLPARQHPFDQHHGTETSGLIWGEDLPSGHQNDAWNTAYYAIAPSVFTQSMSILRTRVDFDPSRFTFVDLGSGKGRAAMLAAEMPFARIVGVELVPSLHAVACENLSHSFSSQNRSPADLLLADATAFPWTEQLEALQSRPLSGPLLLFLYNPFARPVLRALLQRVHHALADDAASVSELGEVWLLYINPELDDELVRRPWIKKLFEETVLIDEEDRLADRFGSTSETFAAYRCTTKPGPAL